MLILRKCSVSYFYFDSIISHRGFISCVPNRYCLRLLAFNIFSILNHLPIWIFIFLSRQVHDVPICSVLILFVFFPMKIKKGNLLFFAFRINIEL